ncbi:MAG: hypothetical protein L6420_03380 [Elusimicrobia bacterium]|nr:hypothetical protein [Elusimicrobiota bacterium]
MRKAFFITSTGVCFFIFLFSACSKKEQIILISTSGISDWLSPETRNNSGFAVLKKAIEKEKQYSIVLDMGNWLTTIPEGRITKANAIIDCMNNVGYSLAMIGNNDLSFPPENFNKILNESEFSLLASNIYLKTGDRPKHTKPHHIVKLQKTSIGIFSINTFDPENLSSAKTLPFYRLEKENYEITRNVKTLLDNGSKIIIMLLNFNSLKNDFHLKEFYKCIASGNYAPDIVIANGLTLEKQLKINRTYFINQGKESSIVLRTQISINPKTGKSSGISSKTISLNKNEFGEDLEVLKIETSHIKKNIRYF